MNVLGLISQLIGIETLRLTELSTCEDKIESVAGDTLSKPSSACKFKLVALV